MPLFLLSASNFSDTFHFHFLSVSLPFTFSLSSFFPLKYQIKLGRGGALTVFFPDLYGDHYDLFRAFKLRNYFFFEILFIPPNGQPTARWKLFFLNFVTTFKNFIFIEINLFMFSSWFWTILHFFYQGDQRMCLDDIHIFYMPFAHLFFTWVHFWCILRDCSLKHCFHFWLTLRAS